MKKSVLLLILTAMAITASACNGSDVTDVTSSQDSRMLCSHLMVIISPRQNKPTSQDQILPCL